MTRAKSSKAKRGAVRLSLEAELTINRAAALKQTLLAALETPGALELDLSKVTELDSAGVQLLLLAQRTAAANDVELRYVDHSPAVTQVLELLGLHASLGPRSGGAA
jgi:anti-sigma B factor antagonist